MESNIISQKQRLEQAFEKIKQDITTKDRAICIQKTGYTKATISRYINGFIDDNDTALLILTILQERIAERDKKLVA